MVPSRAVSGHRDPFDLFNLFNLFNLFKLFPSHRRVSPSPVVSRLTPSNLRLPSALPPTASSPSPSPSPLSRSPGRTRATPTPLTPADNQCNSTTEGASSQCQTGVFNSIEDFCFWGAPGTTPNQTIGDVEAAVVAYVSGHQSTH